MYFDYSDLVQFRLNKKEKTIQCTSSFLKPVHIVMMSILHNYTDYTVGFQYHADYAEAMRFDDPLEVDTVDGSYHRKAIKLQDQFVDDSQMKKIMDILYDNNYLDYGTNDILQLVIAEIFQNFYAHADVEEPPICCVQDWPSSDFLEISLADNGIGINNALRDYLRDYPDSINPCRMACNLGVSSCLEGKGKLGTNHSGYGLYYTKRFIEENQGILFLFSGDKCYINKNGTEYDEILPYSWLGTVVRLVINKRTTLDSENFFQKIGNEIDGGDDENFF